MPGSRNSLRSRSANALYQRVLNIVANPRPFIKTKTYFGPDRRRNPPKRAARQSQVARMTGAQELLK